MKKAIVFILPVLCLLQHSTLYAKSNWGIKFGTNYSAFRMENETKLKPGFSVGVVRTKPVFKNGFFTWEILLNNRKGILKELLVPTSVSDPYYSVTANDIDFSVYQLEIPLSLKYSIYENRKLKLQLHGGAGLSLSLIENEKSNMLYWIDSFPEQITEYDAHLTHLDPTSGGGGFMYIAGIGIEFPLLLMECRYYRAYFDIEPTDAFYMHKELDSFHLTLIFQPSKILKNLF
jgi:hypothetical protein